MQKYPNLRPNIAEAALEDKTLGVDIKNPGHLTLEVIESREELLPYDKSHLFSLITSSTRFSALVLER